MKSLKKKQMQGDYVNAENPANGAVDKQRNAGNKDNGRVSPSLYLRKILGGFWFPPMDCTLLPQIHNNLESFISPFEYKSR